MKLSFCSALCFLCSGNLLAAASRPNIVLIMVDDMGYSDIGPYGGEIATPNLDALAKNGLRFSQFYNSARCCPTRATLVTGLHPHQTGIGHMTREQGPGARDVPPAYAGNLNDSCVTIAQVAKSAGYATFMAGKWHLAGSDQADWPLQRGFDRYYGCLHGATHYFHPYGERIMYDGNTPDPTPESTTERKFYTTDAFTDHAIRFIDGHRASPQKDQPFLLSLAPAFDGKMPARKSPIFLEHEDHASVRDGDWKLVGRSVSPASGLQRQKWELYNLKEDGTELKDLAAIHPDKVFSLSAQWETWAQRVRVFPKLGQKVK